MSKTIEKKLPALALAWGLLVTTLGCAAGSARGLSPADVDELKRVGSAYAAGWLSGDAEAVMATFVPEPVLSPSGLPFLEGQAAARGFWWPPGSPPARVLRFEPKPQELGGSGDLAYVRGTFVLVFEYAGTTYTQQGKYLHLLEKVPGTGWRISHRFWDDLPSDA